MDAIMAIMASFCGFESAVDVDGVGCVLVLICRAEDGAFRLFDRRMIVTSALDSEFESVESSYSGRRGRPRGLDGAPGSVREDFLLCGMALRCVRSSETCRGEEAGGGCPLAAWLEVRLGASVEEARDPHRWRPLESVEEPSGIDRGRHGRHAAPPPVITHVKNNMPNYDTEAGLCWNNFNDRTDIQ